MEWEKTEPGKKIYAQAIWNEVGKKYTTMVSASLVKHVQENMVGEWPKKRGSDGGIVAMNFKLFTIAYESFC